MSVTATPITPTSSIYDLLPLLAVEAPDCPENMLKLALREALREFCMNTGVWTEALTLASVADEDEYDLADLSASDVQPWRVVQVTIDDAVQDTTLWTFKQDGLLTLGTAPAADDQVILVDTVMLPDASCENVPVHLLQRYRQALASAALWRLKGQTGKPWSDMQGATLKERDYRYLCGVAKGLSISDRVPLRRFV